MQTPKELKIVLLMTAKFWATLIFSFLTVCSFGMQTGCWSIIQIFLITSSPCLHPLSLQNLRKDFLICMFAKHCFILFCFSVVSDNSPSTLNQTFSVSRKRIQTGNKHFYFTINTWEFMMDVYMTLEWVPPTPLILSYILPGREDQCSLHFIFSLRSA